MRTPHEDTPVADDAGSTPKTKTLPPSELETKLRPAHASAAKAEPQSATTPPESPDSTAKEIKSYKTPEALKQRIDTIAAEAAAELQSALKASRSVEDVDVEGSPEPKEQDSPSSVVDDVEITDQDVLFGRGGQTNRHIGNLRYRDIISIHREDYNRASRAGKPKVAQKIVAAIRSGLSPGRFLRREDDGKWHEVSDQEAAWKASQALREKSRWSCMKEDSDDMSEGERMEIMRKRKLDFGLQATPQKKSRIHTKKSSSSNSAFVGNTESKVVATLTAASYQKLSKPLEISIPPVYDSSSPGASAAKSVEKKVILVPNNVPSDSAAASSDPPFKNAPRDEDVLFGRGGGTNNHPGNKRLRAIVNQYRYVYQQSKKVDKPKVSKLIVEALRNANPPSRFLRMEESTKQWVDVGDKRAQEKVSQTLREKDKHGNYDED